LAKAHNLTDAGPNNGEDKRNGKEKKKTEAVPIPADAIEVIQDTIEAVQSNPDAAVLRSILDKYHPNLEIYEKIYQGLHQEPELSGRESETSFAMGTHLGKLGFDVRFNVGGYGVVGVYRNSRGKTVLLRAEMDALPVEEESDVPYRSTKRMVNRYRQDLPVMHACGHDMNMAALLAATDLLMAARARWSGTLIVVFQPDAEEPQAGGAKKMVEDGKLYDKVPVPDVMLAQHVTSERSGSVCIRSGTGLLAADTAHVRIFGGYIPGSYPPLPVEPMALAVKISNAINEKVSDSLRPDEDATVVTEGFVANNPRGHETIAFVDFALEMRTDKPSTRKKVLGFVESLITDECLEAGAPHMPRVSFAVAAPLTSNSPDMSQRVAQAFKGYFNGVNERDMRFTHPCEDFAALGAGAKGREVPYVVWNFGGSAEAGGEAPANGSAMFAPVIRPTLSAGTDAMALAALTFLVMRDENGKAF
jgi:amidohydrolase